MQFLVKALTTACSEQKQEGIKQGQGPSFIRQMRILQESKSVLHNKKQTHKNYEHAESKRVTLTETLNVLL
jgi:hypothetical protein